MSCAIAPPIVARRMLRAAVNSGYGYGPMTKFRTSTSTVVRCDTNNCRICHARRTEAHINQCFEALCPYHTYSSRAGHTSPLLRSYLGSRSTGARTRQRSSEMVWYGMRQHCCILFSYSLLSTPSSSPGDSWHRSIPFGLTEHSLLAEPGLHPIYRCAWESYAVGEHLTPLEHTGPCTPRHVSH